MFACTSDMCALNYYLLTYCVTQKIGDSNNTDCSVR